MMFLKQAERLSAVEDRNPVTAFSAEDWIYLNSRAPTFPQNNK